MGTMTTQQTLPECFNEVLQDAEVKFEGVVRRTTDFSPTDAIICSRCGASMTQMGPGPTHTNVVDFGDTKISYLCGEWMYSCHGCGKGSAKIHTNPLVKHYQDDPDSLLTIRETVEDMDNPRSGLIKFTHEQGEDHVYVSNNELTEGEDLRYYEPLFDESQIPDDD